MKEESPKMYNCWCCHRSFHEDYVTSECSAHSGGYVCPACGNTLASKPEAKPVLDYLEFLPTLDQVRYLRHMNNKQHAKVEHALKQTIDIDTKLAILEEILLEKENTKERK